MSRKILVVEDERVLSGMIQFLLQGKGFEVRTALTGEEALGLTESFKPDLLVLDLMLPDMNGLDLLQTLRCRPEARTLPVVVMTTLKSKASKDRAQQLGASAYITKPFEPQALVAAVGRALGT